MRAGDLVARYGGEEFVLITTTLHADKALQHAQALCYALEQMAVPHAISPFGFVTASIGVAVMAPAEDRAAEDLLKQADLALYRAKAQGRNQTVLANML